MPVVDNWFKFHFTKEIIFVLIIYFRGNSGTRGMFSSSMPSNLSGRGRNLSGGLPGQDELYNFHLDGVPPYGEVIKNA